MQVRTQDEWNALGATDPFSAILTKRDRAGQAWDAETFFDTGRREIRGVVEQVRAAGLALPVGRALDFGCGVGRLSQALTEHFASVDGVDISHRMVEWARTYNQHGERCRYQVNGEDDLRLFPDGAFAFVYSNIVLQHIAPRHVRNYIREFLRVLSPEGLLVFQMPSRPRREPRLGAKELLRRLTPTPLVVGWRNFRHPDQTGKMHVFPQARLIAFVERCGGRVRDAQPDSYAGPGWESYRYVVTKR